MRLGWGMTMVLAGASTASAQVDPLAPLPVVTPVATPVSQVIIHRAPIYTIPAPASASSGGFSTYKSQLAARARSDGVREATIQNVVPYLTLNSRVITLDRGQPGQVGNPNSTPPFAPYRREHVTSDLIRRGRIIFSSHYGQLSQIGATTGVDPSILVSIFGHETSYGTVTGGFDLLDALATLAYEGRRRELFESEFVAAIKLLDRGTARSRLKGSWAGATGYPQFMPSAVLRLARDGDGDGVANIWASQADGFASIAQYMKEAGWRPGVAWGIAVRVPYGFDRAAVRSLVAAPKCPRVYARHSRWKSLAEWRALGVAPVSSTRGLLDSEPLSLLEPDGPNATAYLLSHNYRVILDYNCSNFYALAVGLLADAIARRG